MVDAEEMAEDLRKVCAGATSGMPVKFSAVPVLLTDKKRSFSGPGKAGGRKA